MPLDNFYSQANCDLYSDPLTISFTQRELEELLHSIYSNSMMDSASRNDLITKIQYALRDYQRNYEIMLEAQRIVRHYPQYKQRYLQEVSMYSIYSPYFALDPFQSTNPLIHNKIRIACSESLIHCEQALRFIFNNIPENEIELYPVPYGSNYNFMYPTNGEIDEAEFNRLLHKLNGDKTKLGFFND